MNAAGTWLLLMRSRIARRRYLRRVLREGRRQVVFRPAGRLTAAVGVLGYAVAVVPLALVLLKVDTFPGSVVLLVLSGILVTAQLSVHQFLAGLSPRLVRNSKRLFESLATAAVVIVAASPLGEVLQETWRAHPFFWQYGGIGLVAVLMAWVVVRRMMLPAVGLARIRLQPAGQRGGDQIYDAGALGRRDGPRPAGSGPSPPGAERMAVRQPDHAQRAGGHQLAPHLTGLARALAPPVIQDPDKRRFLSGGATDLGKSGDLLTMAAEVVDLAERDALPNITGLRRQLLERQVTILRLTMIEVRARIALAGNDSVTAAVLLGEWAAGLATAGLPNLAAYAWTLRSYVAHRFAGPERDGLDRLADIAFDDSLSLAVRVQALRVAAVDAVGRDIDVARLYWRQARWVEPSRSDYLAVANEARAEAGATWWQRIHPRGRAKLRIDQRRLAIVTEDALVGTLGEVRR